MELTQPPHQEQNTLNSEHWPSSQNSELPPDSQINDAKVAILEFGSGSNEFPGGFMYKHHEEGSITNKSDWTYEVLFGKTAFIRANDQ